MYFLRDKQGSEKNIACTSNSSNNNWWCQAINLVLLDSKTQSVPQDLNAKCMHPNKIRKNKYLVSSIRTFLY